jgi:hypothetical protein
MAQHSTTRSLVYAGRPEGRGITVPISTSGREEVMTDISVKKVSFQHVWGNLDATLFSEEDRTFFLTIRTTTGGGAVSLLSSALPPGDWTLAEIIARIEADLNGEVILAFDNTVNPSSPVVTMFENPDANFAAKSAEDPVTGKVVFNIVMSAGNAAGTAVTYSIANTALTRYLGFYLDASTPSLRSWTVAKWDVPANALSEWQYDLRFSAFYPCLIMQVAGAAAGASDAHELPNTSKQDFVRDSPILATIPLHELKMREMVLYEPSISDTGRQSVQHSQGSLSVDFFWPTGERVHFSNATVYIEFQVQTEPRVRFVETKRQRA